MSRILFIAVLFIGGFVVVAQDESQVANEIRLKVESEGPIQMGVGSGICCRVAVTQFYFTNLFESIWTDQMVNELIDVVSDCDKEGLNPSDYHLGPIQLLANKSDRTAVESAEFELLLTDSFLLLASHMMSGKVDPKLIDPNWKTVRREGDPVEILKQAIDLSDIKGALYGLRPKYKAYSRLMGKLALHRRIAANKGWEKITEGPTLKLGMEDERVLSIRKRLYSTGDLMTDTAEESQIYDESVQTAVKAFQKRHGLEVDGNVGKATLETMNVSVEERIKDIVTNLERCRWLPQDLGDHYVMVNIPAFEMEIISQNELQLEMDVAVGKPYRETPVFSSKMIYLVFNPYWTIPPTILTKDILPAQAKNPNYLKNLNIKVLDSKGIEVSTESIDWTTINPRSFPYQLRQDPGPNNALGEVKFIFPNPYNVYMHDTNHREVFIKADRALSSGCIRLAKPMILVNYLLVQNGGWNEARISEILKSQQNYTVPMSKPLDVHLQYWTSFIDEKGLHNFRKDVYNRNERVYNALMEAPPILN